MLTTDERLDRLDAGLDRIAQTHAETRRERRRWRKESTPTPAPDLQPVLGREAEVIAAGVPPASVRSPILHNVAATIAAPIG